MMLTTTPETVRLSDYTPPQYLIDTVDLSFELHETACVVRAHMTLRATANAPPSDLVLYGVDLELLSLAINGIERSPDSFSFGPETLIVPDVPARFTLDVTTRIRPQDNTSLEGLYRSGSMFCTQCEAEGFRKITYFLDRPDVMARYSVTIIADQARYPVLLSNGNPVARGELPQGRHWVKWQDPFPKPSYLFALVAGDLRLIESSYTTMSGRDVALHIYVEPHNADKCDHALASLRRAMQWDEETWGREYDLDVYMIVAVDDFNMGAMENKGLNIFNASCILARPETATDQDYRSIEGIIGHEYFHNWSGNRVTCRDWFQLSLKEGLTVFRDQQFTADMTSAAVKRIQDVRTLRTAQFPEDAGPMAHPVRPDTYIEISNFYTATVYRKGAELVRMMHTLLGAEAFRCGMDLYFERHDGQAVTTEDFVRAMEEAAGVDLRQFRRWYTQAGTPVLRVKRHYDPDTRRFSLELTQSCPPTPGQRAKHPLHIPVVLALLAPDGRELPLQLVGESAPQGHTRVLELREGTQRFEFEGMDTPPVPSLLRGFSAPVRLEADLNEDDLNFLFMHDRDPFNRWEAGQELARRILLKLADEYRNGAAMSVPVSFVTGWEKTLSDSVLDPALIAETLALPAEGYLGEFMDRVDVDAIHAAREYLRRHLAEAAVEQFWAAFRRSAVEDPYQYAASQVARRALKNACLAYLMETGDPAAEQACQAQFWSADNLSDELAALSCFANSLGAFREEALRSFRDKWHTDPLVMDNWLAVQAGSRLPDTLDRVEDLAADTSFDMRNPNRVRALLGTFCHHNPTHFHRTDGRGYRFVADHVVRLDRINPQVAARLSASLVRWRHYDEVRAALMRRQLERIGAAPELSKDTYEVVKRSLEGRPAASA